VSDPLSPAANAEAAMRVRRSKAIEHGIDKLTPARQSEPG
jgi:hypothetical protein